MQTLCTKISFFLAFFIALLSWGLSVYAATPICSDPGLTIPESECEALADLYTSTVGTQWTIDTHWLTTGNVASWWGVTVVSGYVTEIDLAANHLLGQLPRTLDDLSYLTSLDLENNLLSSVATSFAGPASLTYLNLGYNNIATIPAGFASMTGLEDLYLYHNSLTNLPDIFASFDDLEVLYLQYNVLTSLPDSLGQLSQLYVLDASHNPLGTLPTTMSGMSSLTVLDLDSAELTSLDASIGELENLQVLYLQDNQLTTLPANIGDLSELYYLGLDTNQLTSLPSTFTNLTGLQYLRLDGNALTSLPSGFGDLQELVTLYLNNNALSSIDTEIGMLSGLRFLYLQDNDLLGTLPATFSNLTLLNRLYLYNNKLDRDSNHDVRISSLLTSRYTTLIGAGKQVLLHNQDDVIVPVLSIAQQPPGFSTGSVTLDITRAESSYAVDALGSGLALAMSGSAACTSLSLSTTQLMTMTGTQELTLSGTGAFGGCDVTLTDHAGNVGVLRLDDFVIGSSYAEYCDLPAFETADVIPRVECLALADLYTSTHGDTWTTTTNWFHTTDLEEWFGVRTNIYNGQEHVDGLYLQKSVGGDENGIVSLWDGNNLNGSLPASIGDLSELRYLNISKNILGILPDALGQLNHLQQFYGLDAGLIGSLPTSYDQLDELEILQLPDNMLTGTIPDVIYGMSALKTLSLANNALSGTLTTGIGALTQLEYLRLAGNNLSGPLPASVAVLGGLRELNLADNDFSGTLPSTYSNLTALSILVIHGNALDRDADHDAIIPPSLTTRYSGLTTKRTEDQRDIQAPVMTSGDTIPWVVTGSFTYEVTIDENSYAIDLGGKGMGVTVNGSGVCTGLVSSDIMINDGLTTLTLIPMLSGGYTDCIIGVTDHGGNVSSGIVLPSFVYGIGHDTVCYDPALTIDRAECHALIDLYEATAGDLWYNQTNWTISPDVSTWFGLTVTDNHVTDIQMGGAFANNLSGSLPDSIGDLLYLKTIDLHQNKLTGHAPDSLSQLNMLTELNLSNNLLEGALPEDLGMLSGLVTLSLGYNNFGGAVPTSLGDMIDLTLLDLQHNIFTSLPMSLSGLTQLQTLRINNNLFAGSLPPIRTAMTQLETLDISSNTFAGGLDVLSGVTSLIHLDVGHNSFAGHLPHWLDGFASLVYLSIADNAFVGTIPSGWLSMDALTTLYIEENDLDRERDPTHDAYIAVGSAVESWYDALIESARDNQGDTTAPVLTSPTVLPSTLTEPFQYAFTYDENSYAVTSSGQGMELSFSGNAICATLLSNITRIDQQTGSSVMTVTPLVDGVYNCFVHLRDHGGNRGSVYMGPFNFNSSCGNGVIDPGEACDEGRFCDDMTPCTDDPSICPTECRPRLVDTCNPSCEASRCGDNYIDGNGIDNIAGNYDDETCDVGSYCPDGTDCTRDPSSCPGGSLFCQPRLLHDCNEFCTAGSCGDGTWDVNGEDNIIGTPDDEECDDDNPFNGDGCSSTCRLEQCGDGYVDPNGADNIVSTSDDEECDLGLSNGILGGVCSSTCEIPSSECVYCYELCDGGTGSHSMFLLLDISGSMNNNNRLQNAKQGATSFVDLVMSGSTVNTGFETKIGVIAFNSSSTTLIQPTTNYTGVKTQIASLTAGGGTNFGDAIRDAIDYFETYDTSFDQHMILLSDGEPTVSSNPSFTPGDWAIYQSNNAQARGIAMYTIAVDQTDRGLEYMSHLSSSTRVNHAWEKPVSQESTYSYRNRWYGWITYPVTRSVNATKSGTEFSLTQEHYQPWWEVDLGENIVLEQVNVWNRTSNMHETADYRIHVSEDPFPSTSLSTLLTDPDVDNFYFSGAAQRPSQHAVLATGRYLRIQLTATNQYPESTTINLGLSEVEVIGCPEGELCTSVYHYQDFGGVAIEQIYGHIFGSIHCGCLPERVCGICGDGSVEPLKGEICDEGSYCDDLTTDCTTDDALCTTLGLGECRPRFIHGCTDTCVSRYCGDGQVNVAGEVCDDGNTLDGDGCSNTCTLETCGDGYTDNDGPDNIWGTADDESCDDGNTLDGDGCGASCLHETCGDAYVDLDGPDNNAVTTGDNEQCDTGRRCSDGTDCTLNPSICPGDCHTSFTGLCTTNCVVGSCGDGYVQSGSLLVGSGTITLDEACDLGMFCEDKFTPCGDTPHFCSLLAIGDGTCAPRTIGSCTAACTVNICGDGYLGGTEQCDDGNLLEGDGCNASCVSETCGDGIIDNDGADNVLNTLDDELCDDGNLIDGDGCSSCKLDSCGNGLLDPGEECDTINTHMCVLPYCRLTSCGDGLRQWPNGQGVGGPDDDGYEACDGTTGCLVDCSYTGGTAYCGDGRIDTPNVMGITEVCDDGKDNGTIGSCAVDCLAMPTCGNGIVSDGEQCDDSNIVDGDGCSSTCMLEAPLLVPSALSGTCIAGNIPVINLGEYVPVWRQLLPVDAVGDGVSSCGALGSGEWIIDQGMQCTFGLSAGSMYGPSSVNISVTTDCFGEDMSLLVGDAIASHASGTTLYPVLGSTLLDPTLLSGQFTTQQGQYIFTLDSIAYDYCVRNASGSVIQQSVVYDDLPVCTADVPVTTDYIVQQGAALQEVATTSLDDFVSSDGASLLTVGTLLDSEVVRQQQSSYQGNDVTYLTQEFITTYAPLGVVLMQGVWGVDIWKVPNQRTYIYKDTAELTLDELEIQQIVGDLSDPFTFIITDADFVLDGSLGSLITKTAGMFVVGGEITFSTTSCDTTDVLQGIFIAEEGFATSLTRNTIPTALERCDGGNMIIQGLLIGEGIETLRSQRRATLDAWDTDIVSYTSYADVLDTLGAKVRKLFDICYFPAVIAGLDTALDDGGILCDHTNMHDFLDDAAAILTPEVKQWLQHTKGQACTLPTICETSVPGFTCIYDDSPCRVETTLSCATRGYSCTILADEIVQGTINERVHACVADVPADCKVPYQECEVDMLTNMVTCKEHCHAGPDMTCPVVGMLAWHDALQWMVEQGLPRVPDGGVPSTAAMKQAFDTFDRAMIESTLAEFGISLTSADISRLNNISNITTFTNELEDRKQVIIDGAALRIETAPWLRQDLPPGGSDMLDSVEYVTR